MISIVILWSSFRYHVQCKGAGLTSPCFRVKLTVGSLEVYGEGTTAQAAKHSAATNALLKIKVNKFLNHGKMCFLCYFFRNCLLPSHSSSSLNKEQQRQRRLLTRSNPIWTRLRYPSCRRARLPPAPTLPQLKPQQQQQQQHPELRRRKQQRQQQLLRQPRQPHRRQNRKPLPPIRARQRMTAQEWKRAATTRSLTTATTAARIPSMNSRVRSVWSTRVLWKERWL